MTERLKHDFPNRTTWRDWAISMNLAVLCLQVICALYNLPVCLSVYRFESYLLKKRGSYYRLKNTFLEHFDSLEGSYILPRCPLTKGVTHAMTPVASQIYGELRGCLWPASRSFNLFQLLAVSQCFDGINFKTGPWTISYVRTSMTSWKVWTKATFCRARDKATFYPFPAYFKN